MSRLTQDGTAEPVSRDQILRRGRRQENFHFPGLADHEQDWQHYPADPYSAICDDHAYICAGTSGLQFVVLSGIAGFMWNNSRPDSLFVSIYFITTASFVT